METSFLQRLANASTDGERERVVLEMSLSVLSTEMQVAVKAAAIPHWFGALFLEALLDEKIDISYEQLLMLSFVEQIPGRGYAIHERTRRQLLDSLWQDDPERFVELSGRAALYCAEQAEKTGLTTWQAEAIYHKLMSDSEAGVAGLRELATKWANYEYYSYEEIESVVRLAGEQIEAGRLTGSGADWTRLWQAKLAVIYDRPDLAIVPLEQITADSNKDLYLAAEVAQTRGDRFATIGNMAGAERAWSKAYDLYKRLDDNKGQLDAYLVADKLRLYGLPEPSDEATTIQPESLTPPSHDDLRLMDNISVAWIEGVLKTSLYEKIELRMARDSSRLSNLLYHRPQSIDRPVATGQRLSRLFEASGRSLLILGAPGSGKTVTLLQLLDELLQQARLDGQAPIPLLFNLASFGTYLHSKSETSLVDWLVEQAYNQYRLNRQTTRKRLLEETRFVLLLDGLDEVSNESMLREQCVAAINYFMQTSLCGVVVCSRIGDYQTLKNQLSLTHALVLQPLEDRQIEAFINQVDSPHRATMQEQIQTDWQLRETLRLPLLLNLYLQIFLTMMTPPTIHITSEKTVEAGRRMLFAAYVGSAIIESGPTDSVDCKAKSIRWLAFLASRMQQVGDTVFFVEDLQSTWLPQYLIPRYRGLYGLLIGIILGLISGLLFRLISGPIGGLRSGLIGELSGELIFELTIGLGAGLSGALATWLTAKIRHPWLRAGIGGLITWLTLGLGFRLIFGLRVGLIGGLIFGLIGALGLILSIGITSSSLDIQLRERVKPIIPEPKRIVRYIMQGIFYGLIGGLIFGLVFGLRVGLIFGLIFGLSLGLSGGLNIGLIFGLGIGLGVGLIFGLIGGILAFLNTPGVDKRPTPAGGIRISLRNAFLMTILAAFFLGLLGWFIDQRFGLDFVILFIVLLNILPPTFTWFGGLAWCQHVTLRLILYSQNWFPWRLVPWLDEMVVHGLLHRVGGGYIFIHRSLLEYFATLEEE